MNAFMKQMSFGKRLSWALILKMLVSLQPV